MEPHFRRRALPTVRIVVGTVNAEMEKLAVSGSIA